MHQRDAAPPATERSAPPASRAAPHAQPLLAIQRTAGNAALGQALRRAQARHVARSPTGCGCAACSSSAPAARVDEDELHGDH